MHLLSGNTYCHHCWLGAKAPEKNLQDCTIGIVGVGHVGKIVARYGKLLGMQVLLNDPPPTRSRKRNRFCSFRKNLSGSRHRHISHSSDTWRKIPDISFGRHRLFQCPWKNAPHYQYGARRNNKYRSIETSVETKKKYRRLSLIAGKTSRT